MEFLIPLMAIFAVFGPIAYTIKRAFDLREQKLLARPDAKLLAELSETSLELETMREERKQLLARVENLESIVCSVDYELNARLANLPSQPALLPASRATGEGAEQAADKQEVRAEGGTETDIARRKALARTVEVSSELQIGDTLANRYRIVRLLGRGGMGAVYLADDEVLGEPVALKVISSGLSHDRRAALERFRREASAARRVSAPNVIRIHDLGETPDGHPYISMEHFAGKPLSAVIAARGTLDNDDGYDILGQICDGLEAAHKAGVIHRDLKPQNVLVGPRNSVKIIDFGLAKSSFMPEMTATGLIMGTPHYMSPEQVRGRDVDARSDIYSLGALTYHAMTGRPPFDGKTPIAIGFAHCSEPPVPPRTLRPKLSPGLNDMILAALAKKPADRPQSASEFRTALDV